MFCLTEIFPGSYQSDHNFISCLGSCYISLNFLIFENSIDLANFLDFYVLTLNGFFLLLL